MAKRKMSERQRESIRKEIKQGLSRKKKKSVILSRVAEKYKISTETVRWYLKSLSKNGKAAKQKKKRRRRARTRAHANGSGNGPRPRLFDLIRSVSEQKLKLALRAKRLVPALEARLKKADSLRRLERKVKSNLKSVTAQAAKIEKKIRSLTGN